MASEICSNISLPRTEVQDVNKMEQRIENGEGGPTHQEFSRHKDEKAKCDEIKMDVELLGSVTTSENPGVRISARVIQKMKQDSIRPVTPPPAPAPEKKEITKDDKSVPKTPSQPKPGGRVVWTNLERSFFFDAVNEFGKDFDAIANAINAKIKRKNPMEVTFKSRDHVRQLYYQTFHKVSKYVKFSDEIKKPAQELYGIINYGEMRRKLTFVSEKNCMKIKELVYKGYVSIRNKGKTIRIKTPSCKALRRLNHLEEWQGDIKLPNRIEVRLKPATMESFGRVQNMAQNPIVRTIVPLQKKVISLIKTFQHKWRHQNVRWDEKSAKIETDEAVPVPQYQDQLICLAPEPTVPIYKPMINISEILSNINVCLNAYEDKVGVKVRGETLCHDRVLPNKRQRSDSGCEKKSPENKKIKADTDPKQSNQETVSKETKVVANNEIAKTLVGEENQNGEATPGQSSESDGEKSKIVNDVEMGVAQLKEEEQANNNESTEKPAVIATTSQEGTKKLEESATNGEATAVIKKNRKKYKKPCNTKNNNHILKPLLDEEMIKKVRQGWSMLNVGDITIGDVYLMFGKDAKVILEYSWIEAETKIEEKNECELDESGVPYTHINNNENKYEECLRNLQSNSLANKLRHLLIIANLSEKAQRKCTCGHVCDSVFRPKKFENELKSFVSSKTYSTSQGDNGLFRQPAAPFRRNLPTEYFRTLSNGGHLRPNKFLKNRISPSKQVVVKRLLPLQPGVKQSYDIVATQLHFKAFQRSLIEAGNLKLDSRSRFQIEEVNEEEEVEVKAEKEQKVAPKTSVQPKHKIENNIKSEREQTNRKKQNEKSDEKQNGTSAKTSTVTGISKPDNVKPGPSSMPNEVEQIKPVDKEITTDTDSAQSESTDLFSSGMSSPDFSEDPGLKQLMEIPLPSPMPLSTYEHGDSYSDIPPMSPMRLVREGLNDTRWLDENLSDFSLSSLLGHLDEASPDLSGTASGNMSILSESSTDFIAKFAELTASMQNQDKDL